MVFIKYVIVAGSSTEIVAVHAIFSFTVETSHRKNCFRQCIRYIRISIQPRVGITHCCIIHCTVSPCLVRIVSNLVSLSSRRILISTQHTQFYLINRFVFQFTLEFHIYYIQVHIVVFQFMQDVERRIVTHVVFIRVECT